VRSRTSSPPGAGLFGSSLRGSIATAAISKLNDGTAPFRLDGSEYTIQLETSEPNPWRLLRCARNDRRGDGSPPWSWERPSTRLSPESAARAEPDRMRAARGARRRTRAVRLGRRGPHAPVWLDLSSAPSAPDRESDGATRLSPESAARRQPDARGHPAGGRGVLNQYVETDGGVPASRMAGCIVGACYPVPVRDPSPERSRKRTPVPGTPESSSPSRASDGGLIAESLLAGIERAAHRAQAPGEEEVRDLRGRRRSSASSASRPAAVRGRRGWESSSTSSR
jgi:hypothetical protein